jgi:scyllo-inositol 2-dehydrogenase (NAD+)
MVSKLKAAVIGCGRMGATCSRSVGEHSAGSLLSHAESLLLTKNVYLNALCDVDAGALDKWGNHYKIDKLYLDYKKLIDEVKPEIITIATRTKVKKEIIEYACNNGVKGIYVEKPLANSLMDCESIFHMASKNKVKICYGVNRRYHPLYRKAKELILRGDIGEVLNVTVDFGVSLLMWTHAHSMDLIVYFLGTTKLNNVQASLKNGTAQFSDTLCAVSDPLVEHAYFQFDHGLDGTITSSPGFNVRISGADGNIIVHANGAFIEVNKKHSKSSPYYLEHSVVHYLTEQKATVFAMDALASSVLNNSTVLINHEEISIGMAMLLGCIWSHSQLGKPVSFNDIPSDLEAQGMYNGMYA